MNVPCIPNSPALQDQSVPSSFFTKYLGRVFRTFDALPQEGKGIEVIKRIILAVSSIILLPLLGLVAVAGTLLKKCKTGNLAPKEVKSTIREPVPIAKPPAPLPIQIAHYETIACVGYDVQRLQATQAEMDKRGIPLHVCPKRPENVHPVNYEKANAYIASLPASHKDTFEKVWKMNFLHISMQDFDVELKRCIERFNALINKQNYVVGFASGKSSQWVASLALKDLENLPASWMTLGRQQTNVAAGYRIHIPTERLTLPDDDRLPLVLFDDCGYSGTQLTETLNKIAKETKSRKTVYLIVPYLSEIAHSLIATSMKECQQAGKLAVVLITSEKRIPWAGDNLSVEEMRLVHDLIPTIVFTGSLSMFLCVTDWRIPDNLPGGFGKQGMKHIVEGHSNSVTECDGCKTCQIKADENFIAFTRDVPRPYALPGNGS